MSNPFIFYSSREAGDAGMRQPIFGGKGGVYQLVKTGTSDYTLYGNQSLSVGGDYCLSPANGTLTNLKVRIVDTAGFVDAGKTNPRGWTFCVVVNGSDTSLSTQIYGAQSSNESSAEITVAPWDKVWLKTTPSSTVGTAAPLVTYWDHSLVWKGGNKEAVVMGGHRTYVEDGEVTNYVSIVDNEFPYSTALISDSSKSVVRMPLNGTFKNLYFQSYWYPTSGNQGEYTLVVNNSESSLKVTLTGTQTTASNLVNSVFVKTNDLVVMKYVGSGPSVTGAQPYFGMVFVPENNLESPIFIRDCGQPLADEYYALTPNSDGVETTIEDSWGNLCPGKFAFSNLHASIDTAPGTSGVLNDSWSYTVRRNQVNQSLTCAITQYATSASDVTNSFVAEENDVIDLLVSTTNSPDYYNYGWHSLKATDSGDTFYTSMGTSQPIMKLFNTYLGPASNRLIDLGASNFRWDDIYFHAGNATIHTSNMANLADGTMWFQSSSNSMYLFICSNNSKYFVQMST